MNRDQTINFHNLQKEVQKTWWNHKFKDYYAKRLKKRYSQSSFEIIERLVLDTKSENIKIHRWYMCSLIVNGRRKEKHVLTCQYPRSVSDLLVVWQWSTWRDAYGDSSICNVTIDVVHADNQTLNHFDGIFEVIDYLEEISESSFDIHGVFQSMASEILNQPIPDLILNQIILPPKQEHLRWIQTSQQKFRCDKVIYIHELKKSFDQNTILPGGEQLPPAYLDIFIKTFLKAKPEEMVFNDSSYRTQYVDYGLGYGTQHRFSVGLPGFCPNVRMVICWETLDDRWDRNDYPGDGHDFKFEFSLNELGTIVRPLTLNWVQKNLTGRYPELKYILQYTFNQIVVDEAKMWLGSWVRPWWKRSWNYDDEPIEWQKNKRLKPFDHTWRQWPGTKKQKINTE